jgi:hypothetical protein
MKKRTLLLSVVAGFLSSAMYSQIGINTTNPASTFDVTAKNATGTTTNVDGLLIPRVDRQRAQSMASVPTSTLIYVNGITTGTQTGTAVNIDAAGYYYYNGTVWTKLNPNSSTAAAVNIYNADGTLTGNRTVTQGASTLKFTGTAVNAFSVDGSTLSVDAANDRLGIGTTAPATKLHVEGSEFINAAITGSATKNALDINIGQDGYSYGNRLDNYGINMRTASSANGGAVARINFGDKSTVQNNLGNRYLSFSVGKTPNELMYLTDENSGRVGIGTIVPANKLHIVASADPLKLEGITAGSSTTDKLLVVDAGGVVKNIGSLGALSIPSPAVFKLVTQQNNFLNGTSSGAEKRVPMSLVKNSITGLTYNNTTSTITFPAGTYQMTFVYEGTHNNTNCTVSSYYVDFPISASNTQRVHSTASHLQGQASNHGGNITYVATIPEGTTWPIELGRGISGNCSGPGMLLRANSTLLLVYRIGD